LSSLSRNAANNGYPFGQSRTAGVLTRHGPTFGAELLTASHSILCVEFLLLVSWKVVIWEFRLRWLFLCSGPRPGPFCRCGLTFSPCCKNCQFKTGNDFGYSQELNPVDLGEGLLSNCVVSDFMVLSQVLPCSRSGEIPSSMITVSVIMAMAYNFPS
jgi:hypothetical protein